jgi:hypothetical protein
MTLVYLTVSWLAGIALVEDDGLLWQVVVLGLTAVIGMLSWRDECRVRFAAFCLLALSVGAIRMLLALDRFVRVEWAESAGHLVDSVAREAFQLGPDRRLPLA